MACFDDISERFPGRSAIDPDEAALLLGTHPGHVRRLLREGRLPGIKLGSRWLIPISKLAALLDGDVVS